MARANTVRRYQEVCSRVRRLRDMRRRCLDVTKHDEYLYEHQTPFEHQLIGRYLDEIMEKLTVIEEEPGWFNLAWLVPAYLKEVARAEWNHWAIKTNTEWDALFKLVTDQQALAKFESSLFKEAFKEFKLIDFDRLGEYMIAFDDLLDHSNELPSTFAAKVTMLKLSMT